MVKEKLIQWAIRNCDEINFVGMGWFDLEKGILFLDWTRQGNTGWTPSDAARAWAEQKGHLKKKKPRDLKAGLRNAFRSKKEHLVKVVIPKQIAEKDGRKRMLWQFIDLKSERERISNPTSKCGQKKLTTRKSRRDMNEMMMEDNSPSCSSTLSDFEYRVPKPEETHVKVKSSRKKVGRTKKASTKQSMDTSKPLPPIESLMRSCSFNETVCDTYQLPLQSQDISSTFTEAQFPKNATDSVSFPPKLFSYPSGPTPPPQKTDVMYDAKRENSYVSLFSLKSGNYFSYDQCQDSLFMSQSNESRQSPHSSSPLWNSPIHTQSQSSQVLNQSDEGSHSPHSISPIWNSPIHNLSQSSQVRNQSDEGSHSPHSSSPLWNISSLNQIQTTQILNQSDDSRNAPQSSLPLWLCPSHNKFQITQAPNQPDRICDATPSNPQPCFSSTNDQFQDSVIQCQNISGESSCDNFLRVTSPSLYTDVQLFPTVYENQSIFLDFPEIPPLEFSRPEEVQGFEAPIDDTENIFSQLNIHL